jgi:hypothetical protein
MRNVSSWAWISGHKWKLLLAGMIMLLMISPIPGIYDEQDNEITPLTSIIFLAVIFGTAERKLTAWLLAALTMGWLVISVATDGSGLFAGPSLVAPLLFMVLLGAIFILLARWMTRAKHVNADVLCAAICGYLLLGVLWTGFYATAAKMRVLWTLPGGFATSPMSLGDMLYFSFTTLTTTGYGDIAPRGGDVRMLAMMEAMTGVFYNTIVIARIVGLYGFKREE